MTKAKSRIAAAVVGVLGVGSSAALAAEPTAQELQQQMEQLQAKIEQLQASQQKQLQTHEQSSTIQSVLDDAERRSMAENGILAGHEENKFFLRSEDDSFRMNIGAQFQFRGTVNDSEDADGDDHWESGFEVRRMKLNLDGHAYDPRLQYYFQWEHESDGGSVVVEDAWIKYQWRDDTALQIGQFKDFLFHEENVSSKRQLAVDRSLMNELLAGGETDYVQGIAVIHEPNDEWRLMAALHDGYNSDNTSWPDAGGTGFIGITPTEWGISGRAEYFVEGTQKMYDDFTAYRNDADLLVIGGGLDYSAAGDDHVLFYTIDAQWEPQEVKGLSVYGAFVGAMRETEDLVAGEDSFDDNGLLLQAGYMIAEKCEVFGRWDVTLLDDAALAPGAEDTINEFTVGMNHYWHGHNAKLTVDLTYLPDGSPVSETGIGVLATEEDSLILRGQIQLVL